MEPKDFGSYLKRLRKGKKLTVRQLDLYSGVSHSYISQMEGGSRGIPSPEILEKLSKPLGIDYEELMRAAGYLEENKKENAEASSKSNLDLAVEKIERDLEVSIKDDPEIMEALESYLRTLGKMKKK